MQNKLVVKDNALINASYYLSLVEQRLLLLGIVEARDNQSQNNEFTIHVNSYINAFGVDDSTAYLSIKDACKHLKRENLHLLGLLMVYQKRWKATGCSQSPMLKIQVM